MFKYTSHKLSLLAHLLPGYYHYVLYACTYKIINTASPWTTWFLVSRIIYIAQNHVVQINLMKKFPYDLKIVPDFGGGAFIASLDSDNLVTYMQKAKKKNIFSEQLLKMI